MKKLKQIQFSWDEGIYLDLWTVVHLMTGVVFAAGFAALGGSFVAGFLILIGLTVVYELGEYTFGILEHFQNTIVDVIVALAAYAVYFQLFSDELSSFHWQAFAFASAINLVLAFLGYKAYRRRENK